MKKILKWVGFLLGFIWCSPVTLLSLLFYQGPLYFLGMVEKVHWRKSDLAIIWDVKNGSKFYRVMSGWFGNVVGANITVTDIPDETDEVWLRQAMVHEGTHVFQNYIFGVFYFFVYIGNSVFIWLFQKDKHTHIDNFFERWAREVAGQPVDVPRDQWYDGPNDRIPWW